MIQENFFGLQAILPRGKCSRKNLENEIKEKPGPRYMSVNFQNSRSEIKIVNPSRVGKKKYMEGIRNKQTIPIPTGKQNKTQRL